MVLYEGKPSVGRKFLVAGKGGLNITHGESRERFTTRYTGPDQPAGTWESLIADFDSTALREWAAGLGIETFLSSNGRAYPREMKAAPLLRRWIARLRGLGVDFRAHHRLVSLEPGNPWQLGFENGATATADAVILALGGGSWQRTGSDGAWGEMLDRLDIARHPLCPANCGWEHAWPADLLEIAEGLPLKNIHASAAGKTVIGELMVTRYGLEGGAIYQLGATLRQMRHPAIAIDFKPTFTLERLVAKMQSVRRDFLREARARWKLGDAALAILSGKSCPDAASLAREVKHCVVTLTGPRPLDEAISSAGGVRWAELDADLMVKRHPGLYVAGEMIDWEAPTGGYLIQGCFATGARAAAAAVTRTGLV